MAQGESLISAHGTKDSRTIEVRKGRPVELPFGPPYRSSVTVAGKDRAGQTLLSLSLIGAGGEACTNLLVNRRLPVNPKFSISDPSGNVVEEGRFKFG